MNDRFIEKIANKRGIRQLIIEEIKEQDMRVVIYGAGLTGDNTDEYLKLNNIVAIGFTVDKGYGENTMSHGLPVQLLEYYDAEYESYCVIIAMQNIGRAVENLRKFNSTKLKKVYILSHSLPFLGLVYDHDYIKLNEEAFQKSYGFLEDEISRKTMCNYVNSIVNDNLDINDIRELYDPCQYFAKDVVTLTENEVFVDCGAYDGDTLIDFIQNVPNGKYDKYYALEPDDDSCSSLKSIIDQNRIKDVEIIKKGVWDTEATLKFFNSGITASSCISSTGNIDVEVDSIDNLLFKKTAITFIKMDIQGVELKALQGAARIIRRDKPKLAICVYHKPEDLFEIPLYLKSLVPGYRFYIRHHSWSLIETVLYAVI